MENDKRGFIFETKFKIHYTFKPKKNLKPVETSTNSIHLPMTFYSEDKNTIHDSFATAQMLLLRKGYVTSKQMADGRVSEIRIEVIEKKVFLGRTTYQL